VYETTFYMHAWIRSGLWSCTNVCMHMQLATMNWMQSKKVVTSSCTIPHCMYSSVIRWTYSYHHHNDHDHHLFCDRHSNLYKHSFTGTNLLATQFMGRIVMPNIHRVLRSFDFFSCNNDFSNFLRLINLKPGVMI
jgi:hypothetical protein